MTNTTPKLVRLTAAQRAAGLDSHEQETLRALAIRARPAVGVDVARLEHDGLVAFVRETASGTTWYRITPAGRAALGGAK